MRSSRGRVASTSALAGSLGTPATALERFVILIEAPNLQRSLAENGFVPLLGVAQSSARALESFSAAMV
jgi:hypothetical protein